MQQITQEDGQSTNLIDENIERMKALFPEAFSENGVDFDVLRQLLGDAKVLDEGEEKYGLTWHGKKKARQIALTPSMGTLLPCPQESVDWDTTQNLFIEGDNLEVLKLLQKSYANKVKLIYIDPPYNTGGEFIYPDNYQENLDTYLKYTGQKDAEGFNVTSGTETGGRKHTNWLNMMYPRLKMTKNLLSQHGAIFISIDDNESSNLKLICDDIYGEENFICTIAWQKAFAKKNKAIVSGSHDHILIYTKGVENWERNLLPRSEDQIKVFKNPDGDIRGRWQSISFSITSEDGEKRKGNRYEITLPSGRKVMPPVGSHWKRNYDGFQELVNDNRIWFGKDGDNAPRIKLFLSEVKDGIVPDTWWNHEDYGNNQEAKKEILELFKGDEPFSTPKPLKLISQILKIATNSNANDIILDFFAGSCSTAHAVLKENEHDSGNRKFIMVQLPEVIKGSNKEIISTISKLGIERIKRAVSLIPSKKGLDLGFKVFKLAQSNIRAWNPDRTDLEETLLSHKEHLIEGRSEQDLLYELLLKRGVDLAVPIEERKVACKTIYSIGAGVLFACLDPSISRGEVETVAEGLLAWRKALEPEAETHVFFRDSAFHDDNVAKTNMVAILEQNGITHVRSL